MLQPTRLFGCEVKRLDVGILEGDEYAEERRIYSVLESFTLALYSEEEILARIHIASHDRSLF